MIRCGSQCETCDYPIHFDTYRGCSHNCVYCSGGEKIPIDGEVRVWKQAGSVRAFVNGYRNKEVAWCDWDIPLHWGAVSDPFQPCEKEYKASLACLKVFAETKYPFIVSTKNPVMLTEEPYFSLIGQCRCVLQISMACPKYDKLELGTPNFEERLKAAKMLSKHVTRVIVRVMPYFVDCKEEILAEIPRIAQVGVFGIQVEGFTTRRKTAGMERSRSMYNFPLENLYKDYLAIKEACHKNNLKFFCGECALGWMSDETTCCGTVGLDDFKPNRYNVRHMVVENVTPTDSMLKEHTAEPFKSLKQSQDWALEIKGKSFADLMNLNADRATRAVLALRKILEDNNNV